MPELERWVLHRLAELDAEVRAGYGAYDFQGVFAKVFAFATTDLSALYFDIRKDALYCDAPSSARRRACRTVMEALFDRLTAWLAPILVFTAEDVWLARHPTDDDSIHLHDFPATPAEWRDDALAARFAATREVRRVVTGALEVERTAKVIGASLEAAPQVFVSPAMAAVLGRDFADLCITSDVAVTTDPAPAAAFRLDDVPDVAVLFRPAPGTKCDRCWRVLPDVGTHRHAGLCARCDAAVG
jgi:isoleucyl-tRNA synthetase